MSKIIKLTHGLETIVDDEDYDYLNQFYWYALSSNGSYYAVRQGPSHNNKRIVILIHKVIAERIGLIGRIDHKDRNRLNNKRENLRLATVSQNNINNKIRSDNTSGYKGVTFDKQYNKWVAKIMINKVRYHLGYFNTAEEAAIRYNVPAKRFFGEFAFINTIEGE